MKLVVDAADKSGKLGLPAGGVPYSRGGNRDFQVIQHRPTKGNKKGEVLVPM